MPLAYVAWRADTTYKVAVPVRQAGNRFLSSLKGLQIRALAGLNDKYGCRTGPPGWESIGALLKRFIDTSFEPVFVSLFRSLGIDSQLAGRYANPICRTGL
jgi:hypothetical protein